MSRVCILEYVWELRKEREKKRKRNRRIKKQIKEGTCGKNGSGVYLFLVNIYDHWIGYF